MDKVVKLVGGGSVINWAYPVKFNCRVITPRAWIHLESYSSSPRAMYFT